MRYSKPHFYDAFSCLAGACPDTCCAGWQIYIDEEKLEEYAEVKGSFGNRIQNSIDWEEGAFYQYEGRCAFLNERNLCDLYAELGADSLCETCRMYPRHVEEYDGLRELSLSLSCPEAARMMLTMETPMKLVTWETDEEEDSFEEDEMDYLLFTRLEDAREVMFDILRNREMDLRTRMYLVLKMAEQIQDCMDTGQDFEIDEVIQTFAQLQPETAAEVHSACNIIGQSDYESRKKEFTVFQEMELLRKEWGQTLDCVWDALYAEGEEVYREICRRFESTCGYDSPWQTRWQQMGEQLMMFFVYTYFCGAVYDDMVAVKMRMAVFLTQWIQELVMYRFQEKGEKLETEEVIEMAWRLAREVEHSDINLGILEDWLQDNWIIE